jgi:glutaminase
MPFLPRVYSLLVMCFIACLSILHEDPSLAASPSLPASDELRSLVTEAHARFKGVTKGKNADYIPSLAKVDSNLFGVAIVTVKGEVYVAGDSDHEFTLQSISKPFTLALVLQDHGEDAVVERIGVEPTGMPFNSIAAVELHQSARNPLVNAGAITAISLVKATSKDERWEKIQHTYKTFAGSQSNLNFNQEVYESEAETNQRNHSIARLLFGYGLLHADLLDTVDVYTKQCSLNVTTTQLAKMGATLANGGVNPFTKEQAVDARLVPKILAVMMMAGLYDEAGRWAWKTGIPAKTGVGGGIVAVIPGKLAIAAFSPPLNNHGTSVRAALAIQYISEQLGLNLFDTSR